jgi:hypothetical protein
MKSASWTLAILFTALLFSTGCNLHHSTVAKLPFMGNGSPNQSVNRENADPFLAESMNGQSGGTSPQTVQTQGVSVAKVNDSNQQSFRPPIVTASRETGNPFASFKKGGAQSEASTTVTTAADWQSRGEGRTFISSP